MIMHDATLKEAWWSIFENTLYYLCNSSINLILFQNTKFRKKVELSGTANIFSQQLQYSAKAN